MKVLIITDAWHPQVNGVVTVYTKMKELLEKDGHQVHIIHPGLFFSIPIPFYPEIRLAITTPSALRKIIQSISPNCIHIATEGSLGVAAKVACARNGWHYTTAYHTHFAHYMSLRLRFLFSITYAYLRWFHTGAVRTMVATKSLQQELDEHGFQNLTLWPLGVDTDLFKRNTSISTEEYQKPVFLYVGRVSIEKNIEAFLKLELPGTKVVVGDGPDRISLEKKYGGTAVFVGYKKGQHLVDMFSKADVFVFPSKTDTFGLVIVEALACGVPVVAYDVMGPKDIITQGVDGYLSEDLASGAMKCLAISREQCREKALLFSWGHSFSVFVSSLCKIRQ